jgi:hypothetical protein
MEYIQGDQTFNNNVVVRGELWAEKLNAGSLVVTIPLATDSIVGGMKINASTTVFYLDGTGTLQTTLSGGGDMLRANNLSDVLSVSTSRNNLNVYSKSEVYTKVEADGLFLSETSNANISGNWTFLTGLSLATSAPLIKWIENDQTGYGSYWRQVVDGKTMYIRHADNASFTGEKWSIVMNDEAEVGLYYNGANKLQTESFGASIIGSTNDVTSQSYLKFEYPNTTLAGYIGVVSTTSEDIILNAQRGNLRVEIGGSGSHKFAADALTVNSLNDSSGGTISVYQRGDTVNDGLLLYKGSGNSSRIYHDSNDYMVFSRGSLDKMRLTTSGLLYLIGNNNGSTNTTYLSFYQSDGSTREGYVGIGSSASTDVYLTADTGNVILYPTGGNLHTFKSNHVRLNSESFGTDAGTLMIRQKGQTINDGIFLSDGIGSSFRIYVDSSNNAVLGRDASSYYKLTNTGQFTTDNFTNTGFTGQGIALTQAGLGVFDELTCRGKFKVYELEVDKISHVGGSLILSVARGIVDSRVGNVFTFDTDGGEKPIQFQVGDYVRAQNYNGRDIDAYSGRVTVVTLTTITTVDISGTPYDNMELVQIGHISEADRQNLIYMTTADNDAPYIDYLTGADDGSLGGHTLMRTGKLDGLSGQTGMGIWGSRDGLNEAFVISSDDYARIANWSFNNEAIQRQEFGLFNAGQLGFIRMSTISRNGNMYDGTGYTKGFSTGSNKTGAKYSVHYGEMANTSTPKTGYYGLNMIDDSSLEYFALGANDSDLYCHVANWNFNNQSLYNGTEFGIANNDMTFSVKANDYRIRSKNFSVHSDGTVTVNGTITINNPQDINTNDLTNGAGWTDDTAADAAQSTADTAVAVTNNLTTFATITNSKFEVTADASNFIRMYFTSVSDWGLRGDIDGETLLKLGSGVNIIAGWKITNGELQNELDNRFISISNKESGTISDSRGRRGFILYNNDSALPSSTASVKAIRLGSLSNKGTISTFPATPNYGMQIWAGSAAAGAEIFRADANEALIAGWNFDKEAIFTGTKKITDGFTTDGITMASNGSLRAKKFELRANGDAFFSGTLSAAIGSFSGEVIAESGTIAGFTIEEKKLTSGIMEINQLYSGISTGAYLKFKAVSGESNSSYISFEDTPSNDATVLDRFGIDNYSTLGLSVSANDGDLRLLSRTEIKLLSQIGGGGAYQKIDLQGLMYHRGKVTLKTSSSSAITSAPRYYDVIMYTGASASNIDLNPLEVENGKTICIINRTANTLSFSGIHIAITSSVAKLTHRYYTFVKDATYGDLWYPTMA